MRNGKTTLFEFDIIIGGIFVSKTKFFDKIYASACAVFASRKNTSIITP